MTDASDHIISRRREARVCRKFYGGASRRPTTENDYKLSFAVASVLASVNVCEQHHKTVEELVEAADDKLFTNVMYSKQHFLHSTLPGTMDTKYHLRHRYPTTLSYR